MSEPQKNPDTFPIQFAVSQHNGTWGIVMLDEGGGLSPIGKGDFTSKERALAHLRRALSELMDNARQGKQ